MSSKNKKPSPGSKFRNKKPLALSDFCNRIQEHDQKTVERDNDERLTYELKLVLTEALDRGHLTSSGVITKGKLRSVLRAKIDLGMVVHLDPDQLGQTLSKFEFLLQADSKDCFRINMKKMPLKVEKHSDAPISLKCLEAGTFQEVPIKSGIDFCIFCKSFIPEHHMMTKHGMMATIESHVEPIFSVSHVIDPHFAYVKIFLTNNSSEVLLLNAVQLIHETENYRVVWKSDYQCVLQPFESFELTVERKCLKVRSSAYLFVIFAEGEVANYFQRYRLEINRTLYDMMHTKRKLKERKFDKEPKLLYWKLDEYPPDRGLLKIFTKEFTVRKAVHGLTATEFQRFKKLIEFGKAGCILSTRNYREIMKILVELEDLYVNHQLFRFKIALIDVTCAGLVYSIDISNVPNFPECIQEGDFIVLKEFIPEKSKFGREIVNPVVKMADCRVFFELEGAQKLNIKRKHEVCFRKDRTSIQMEQNALHTLSKGIIERIIFPNSHSTHLISSHKFIWFNSKVGGNAEQQQAVRNIISGSAYPAPYIIFGPPGTGKTATIIETICQIWKHKPKANILVTAPSNAACDEIALRLLKCIPAVDLYRYYSKSIYRRRAEVDEEVKMISNISGAQYEYLSINVLKEYRIIVATFVQTGKLCMLQNLEKNYFEYIFLDECGSATEPASLIPIAGLISFIEKGARTNLILAGDPKQLGPVVTCNFANLIGLGRSLLERLMATEFYQPTTNGGKYNEKVITKLLLNFRSHPAILKIPNELFYDGQLIARGPPNVTNFALNWKFLPKANFPLMFHGVDGQTKFIANSFSMYNKAEIDLVVHYVEEIAVNGINRKPVPLSEIGVVSPYALQVHKIKEELIMKGLQDIQVGSAEQYQGKEKMVIILSTVRSNIKTAGFLGNPKRLNVAITRAKGLLIIVGNPKTLRLDMNWSKLLGYCKESGATKGVHFELNSSLKTHETYEEKLKNSFGDLAVQFEKLSTKFN